ncbi:MAG: hypothetical protein PHQ40_01335 [Anaerolineaceae bacterium]|nr:hypothetical protein [Anaerolineaceae bacterium]
MQTCTQCNKESPDSARQCTNCQAGLSEFSTTSVALKHFQANPRVSLVRISVAADACPVCSEVQGAYPKDQVPRLPIDGCSYPRGCRCFYEPVLDEVYP